MPLNCAKSTCLYLVSLSMQRECKISRVYRDRDFFFFAILCGRKDSAIPLLFCALGELECLPDSLSNATGMFEYSGQKVNNTLLHFLRYFTHGVISGPEALRILRKSSRGEQRAIKKKKNSYN